VNIQKIKICNPFCGNLFPYFACVWTFFTIQFPSNVTVVCIVIYIYIHFINIYIFLNKKPPWHSWFVSVYPCFQRTRALYLLASCRAPWRHFMIWLDIVSACFIMQRFLVIFKPKCERVNSTTVSFCEKFTSNLLECWQI